MLPQSSWARLETLALRVRDAWGPWWVRVETLVLPLVVLLEPGIRSLLELDSHILVRVVVHLGDIRIQRVVLLPEDSLERQEEGSRRLVHRLRRLAEEDSLGGRRSLGWGDSMPWRGRDESGKRDG